MIKHIYKFERILKDDPKLRSLLKCPLFIPSLFIAEVVCSNSYLFHSSLLRTSSFCVHLWFLKLYYQHHLTFQSLPSIAAAHVTYMHQSFIPVTSYSCIFPNPLPCTGSRRGFTVIAQRVCVVSSNELSNMVRV